MSDDRMPIELDVMREPCPHGYRAARVSRIHGDPGPDRAYKVGALWHLLPKKRNPEGGLVMKPCEAT